MSLRQSSRSLLLLRPIPPVLDFLAPSWSLRSLHQLQQAHKPKNRTLSTSTAQQTQSTSTNTNTNAPPQPKRTAQLTASQKAYLSSALRINQAGELAATLIYAAQTPPLTRTHPSLRPLLAHMLSQETGHLQTFNALLAKHRIRPTALRPLWTAAASILGWSTGLLGREAAMACTEAVETEIGGHYNDQVRVLLGWEREMRERGEEVPEELRALVAEVRRIRDEELEHLDTAVENDAREAPAWPVLTAVVRGGCRGAIWVCERV